MQCHVKKEGWRKSDITFRGITACPTKIPIDYSSCWSGDKNVLFTRSLYTLFCASSGGLSMVIMSYAEVWQITLISFGRNLNGLRVRWKIHNHHCFMIEWSIHRVPSISVTESNFNWPFDQLNNVTLPRPKTAQLHKIAILRGRLPLSARASSGIIMVQHTVLDIRMGKRRVCVYQNCYIVTLRFGFWRGFTLILVLEAFQSIIRGTGRRVQVCKLLETFEGS